jgi:hypothetical protein
MSEISKEELWVEFLEGELPIDEFELWGQLLRRSLTERRTLTSLESTRDAVKLSDSVDNHEDYLNDAHTASKLHEKIMQAVMAAPAKENPKLKLLKPSSGRERLQVLRRQPERT